MTDAMRELYDYIQEIRLGEYLSSKNYWRHAQTTVECESALLNTCTPQQRNLLEQYQKNHSLLHQQELEAVFQAAWAVARKLA